MLSPRPKASIVLLTDNYGTFIKQALAGILRQGIAFSHEIIAGADNSADQTRPLVEAYRRRFPDRTKPMYQAHNVGAGANRQDYLAGCCGEHIATIAGGDYWTDALKLAKQVKCLDAHLDFSICIQPVKITDVDLPKPDFITSYAKHLCCFDDFLDHSIAQSSSLMLRNVLRPVPNKVFALSPALRKRGGATVR